MLYAQVKEGKIISIGDLPFTYKGKNPLARVPELIEVTVDAKTLEQVTETIEGGTYLQGVKETGYYSVTEEEYTITNFNSSFTAEELAQFGYLPYTEEKEKCDWYEESLPIEYTISETGVKGYIGKRKKSTQDMESFLRSERNKLLQETDDILMRFSLPDRSDVTNEKLASLLKYRQDLRDLPESNNDLSKIKFPTYGEWL